MKKIIATVLAMVMALALCTTAFAAGWTETLHTKDTNAEYKYYAAVKASCTAKGHEAYYTTLDQSGNVVYYREARNTETENVVVVAFKEKTSAVRLYPINETTEGYTVAVYGHDLSKLSANEAISCTKDGYNKDTFKCATCGKYFYAYEAKLDGVGEKTDSIKNYNPDGLTVSAYNEIDEADEIGAYTTSATHILYKLTNEFDAMGQQEYKCALCGEVVAATAKANLDTFKVLYGTDKLKFYDGTAESVDYWISQNATFNTLNPIITSEMVYVTVTASSTTPSTDKNTSPKTFDAGIAMYVGMALTSVAGSAVVIGKKKEF